MTPSSSAAEPAFSWPGVLSGLIHGDDLTAAAAEWAMSRILAGEATAVQIAGFVVALRSKGETVSEISGLADAMLSYATPVRIAGLSVDVVGSGGDRANTVNVSTMAALVAAAAGAQVVKHGNRAASSACGTADVLEELGVVLDLPPAAQQQVIDAAGISFLFAPHYHPALRHAAVPRRELAIPTTFNFLGPLANPARPGAMAVGVADARMAELLAGVLANRGNQGLVFHGDDGLDELTTTTTSAAWLFAGYQVRRTEIDPLDLGLARASVADLVGGDPVHNAQVVRDLADGVPGPIRDIVLLNAAAALLAYAGPDPAAPLADQLRTGLLRASEALDSGAVKETLRSWVQATQTVGAGSS